jgi:hypothetical protein
MKPKNLTAAANTFENHETPRVPFPNTEMVLFGDLYLTSVFLEIDIQSQEAFPSNCGR